MMHQHHKHQQQHGTTVQDILSMGGSSDEYLDSLLSPPTVSSTTTVTPAEEEVSNGVPSERINTPTDVEFDENGLKIREGSVEAQIKHFKTLIIEGDVQRLLTKALGGSFSQNCFVRSIAWKVFLGVLSSGSDPADSGKIDYSTWKEETKRMREHFHKLVDKHFVDPRSIQGGRDPLSQSAENPWSQFFENNELERTIQQDLNRLYPEHPFFRTEPVQKQLLRVLFVWSKENRDTSYRQGMHELLAPMLLVLHRDRKDRESFSKIIAEGGEDAKIAELLQVLVDEAYLEADLYALFEKLMAKMKEYFLIVEKTSPTRPTDSNILVSHKSLFKGTEEALFSMASTDDGPKKNHPKHQNDSPSDPHMDTPLYRMCDRIQNVLLKKKDPQLYEHLKRMDIEPQIYGLRWIRLLFGREFHLEDVIILWDAIFADCGGLNRKNSFDSNDKGVRKLDLSLVEHIAIMMLVYIRGQLLNSDSSVCLRRLMKYPPVESVQVFVTKALESRQNPDTPISFTEDKQERGFVSDVNQPPRPSSHPVRPQPPQPRPQNKQPAKIQTTGHRTSRANKGMAPFGADPFASPSPSSVGGSTRPVKKSQQSIVKPSQQQQQQSDTMKTRLALEQKVTKEIKLGDAMEKIISRIQRELFEKTSGEPDESVLLMSIAKLKHIKDVLKFQLPLDLDMVEWLEQSDEGEQQEEKKKNEEEQAATTNQEPDKRPSAAEDFVDPLLR